MSNNTPRLEEYTAIAGFLLASFRQDRNELVTRFSKYSPAYLKKFEDQIKLVHELENPAGRTSTRKEITANLYKNADALNQELNFLLSYYKAASLDTAPVSKLKNALSRRNIEGAIHQLTSLKDQIAQKKNGLVKNGSMPENMADILMGYRDELDRLNRRQNQALNQRMTLTKTNREQYRALYDYIREIAFDGKVMYRNSDKNKVKEYTVTNLLQRVRAAQKQKVKEGVL